MVITSGQPGPTEPGLQADWHSIEGVGKQLAPSAFSVSRLMLKIHHFGDTKIQMRIIWDEPKRLANLLKHGMDFAELTLDFFDSAVVVEVGNGRRAAVGALSSGIILVIHVRYGTEAISVISMRAASKKERRLL